MPSAYNPDTGELLTLGQDGQWATPQMAQNPQTGEKIYLDGAEWKPVPFKAGLSEQDRRIENAKGGFGRATDALTQGATMGFADEVGAAGAATGRFLKTLTDGGNVSEAWNAGGRRYDERLAAERGSQRDFAEKNPAANAALQVAGGLATAPAIISRAAAALPAAAPTMAQMAKQSATGAGAMGAVAGFGSGEGSLAERLKNAATTGTISAGIGAATPFAVKGVTEGAQFVRNLFAGTNADEQAQQLILRAMQRDGITVEQAVERYNAGQLTGAKPEAMIDIGGENVRGLARGASNLPGPAKQQVQEFVVNRQAGQGERIADDVAGNLSNRGFHESMDELTRTQRATARPLYEEAFAFQTDKPVYTATSSPTFNARNLAETVDNVSLAPGQNFAPWDARLQQFIDDPIVKKGMSKGIRVQQLEALAEGRPFRFEEYAVKGFDDVGGLTIEGVPNLRAMDAAKRGIDDILEGYRDKTTGKLVLDDEGRAIDSVRRALVKKLDEITTDATGRSAYQEARKAWSGPAQSKNALQMGRDSLTVDSEVTDKMVAALSPADREFFRAGVARAIKDIADKTRDGADITKRIFGTPAIRARLEAAFETPQQFQAFENAIGREARMYANAQQVSPRAGSRTATLDEEIADVRKNPVVQFLSDVVTTNPYRATVNATGRLYDRGRGINEGTSRSLARMLLETDPQALRGMMGDLSGRQAADLQKALEIARKLGLAGTLQGRSIGVLSN